MGICRRAQRKYTPLHLASLQGHLESVRLLLAAGAKVDAKTNVRVAAL